MERSLSAFQASRRRKKTQRFGRVLLRAWELFPAVMQRPCERETPQIYFSRTLGLSQTILLNPYSLLLFLKLEKCPKECIEAFCCSVLLHGMFNLFSWYWCNLTVETASVLPSNRHRNVQRQREFRSCSPGALALCSIQLSWVGAGGRTGNRTRLVWSHLCNVGFQFCVPAGLGLVEHLVPWADFRAHPLCSCGDLLAQEVGGTAQQLPA